MSMDVDAGPGKQKNDSGDYKYESRLPQLPHTAQSLPTISAP